VRHIHQPAALHEFSTVERLLVKSSSAYQPRFPYERELARYLLLVSSLWPENAERRDEAARIFAGAINIDRRLAGSSVKRFNAEFFDTLGGLPSLLHTKSSAEFHKEMVETIADLSMLHDVLEFVMKSSLIDGGS
jgi:hypothetical protein